MFSACIVYNKLVCIQLKHQLLNPDGFFCLFVFQEAEDGIIVYDDCGVKLTIPYQAKDVEGSANPQIGDKAIQLSLPLGNTFWFFKDGSFSLPCSWICCPFQVKDKASQPPISFFLSQVCNLIFCVTKKMHPETTLENTVLLCKLFKGILTLPYKDSGQLHL